MNKNNIFITIKKELRSMFRDKKTLFMIFGFPFIIAFMIFLMGCIYFYNPHNTYNNSQYSLQEI